MNSQVIKELQKAGLGVYMGRPSDTYAYFTDGVRIGYVQWSKGEVEYSTVHKPSGQVGTGFRANNAEDALRMTCPSWAFHNAGFVHKWASWEAFQKDSEWNRRYKLVVNIEEP